MKNMKHGKEGREKIVQQKKGKRKARIKKMKRMIGKCCSFIFFAVEFNL